jgi:hypothetical protein
MRSYRKAFARAAAVVLALSGTVPASAQLSLSPGVWTSFQWFDVDGLIDDPLDGFFLSFLDPVRVRVTDAFQSGDAFDVLIDGALRLATASVPGGIDTGAAAGDAAWADPRLSKGEFVLEPSGHQLDIRVRVDGGFEFGEAFIQVTPLQVIPEPVTLLLVGSGLVGVAGTAWRSRRQVGTRRTPRARAASGR